MKKKRMFGAAALAAAVAAAVGGFVAGRASADGVPTGDGALTYSGMLEDVDGTPVAGERTLRVQLWDQPSEGEMKCDSGAVDVTLERGRFSIALPAECTTAASDNPDLYVEVMVNGESLGTRTKLAAVPYAVEAARAGRLSAPPRIVAGGGSCTANDGSTCEYTVSCSADEVLVGGGCRTDAEIDGNLVSSVPLPFDPVGTPTGWQCRASRPANTGTYTIYVRGICLPAP